MNRRLTTGVAVCLFIFTAGIANAEQIELDDYDVYFGDFNNDGLDGDVYFRGKDLFILIHGDISIPLSLPGAEGFAYFEGDSGTVAYTLSSDLLSQYTQGVEGQDYHAEFVNGDGWQDVVVAPPGSGGDSLVLFGGPSSSTTEYAVSTDYSPQSGGVAVTTTFTYDALGRLTFVEDPINGNRDFDYDDAGNRTAVAEGVANEDENPHDTEPESLAAPTGLLLQGPFSQAGGYSASWNSVANADRYVVGMEDGSEVEMTNTSIGTAILRPVWVYAENYNSTSAKSYF